MDGDVKQLFFMVLLEGNEKLYYFVKRENFVVYSIQGVLLFLKFFLGNVNLFVFFGFSIVGGKLVIVLESVLYKVKGMLEEFDLIRIEYIFQYLFIFEDVLKIFF